LKRIAAAKANAAPRINGEKVVEGKPQIQAKPGVLLVIPTLVGAAALVFVLMRLIPGDICVVRLGSGGGSVDPRAVALCHAELGLDRPLILQFLDFVWGFFRLDLGI